MNQSTLVKKELSNFYAINKQVNQYFNGSEIDFLPENIQQILMDYVRITCACEEDTSSVLHALGFNPTNTIDSIVQEITRNLQDTIREEISDDVKATGYQLSLNRLIGYQISNLENLKFMTADGKYQIEDILRHSDSLAHVKKNILA